MAYYNRESLPWPRQPVQDPNYFAAYQFGINSYQGEDTSSIDRNYRNHRSPNAPNTSRQRPQKVQSANQTKKQFSAKVITAENMKKSLLEGISKPVESSKAERIMQMMGWKGGALGRTGDGLKEPLAPNLQFKSGAGLGHETEEAERQKAMKASQQSHSQTNPALRVVPQDVALFRQQQRQPNKPIPNQIKPNPSQIKTKPSQMKSKPSQMDRYDILVQQIHKNNSQHRHPIRKLKPTDEMIRMQALEDILTFVKDNRRIELKMSPKLKDGHRFSVHQMVECIREKDLKYTRKRSSIHPELMSVFLEVCHCNEYVLQTQSEGIRPMRQLVVYKEAPEHVYLITNDDLVDGEPVDDDDEEESPHDEVDAICKSNQFINALIIKQERSDDTEEDITNTEIKLENVEVKTESTNHYESQNMDFLKRTDAEMMIHNVAAKTENTTNQEINHFIDHVAVKTENTTDQEMMIHNVAVKTENTYDEEMTIDHVAVKTENTTDEVMMLGHVADKTGNTTDEEMMLGHVGVKTENTTDEEMMTRNVAVKTETTPDEEITIDNVAVKTENTTDEEMMICNVAVKKENTTYEERLIHLVAVKKAKIKEAETNNVTLNRILYLRKLFKKYLKEFFESAEYTEMWFLGAFDDIEQLVLDDFIRLMVSGSRDGWVSTTILGKRYRIQFDNNGSEIIVKY